MNSKTLAYAALLCVIALGIWLNMPDSKNDNPFKDVIIVSDTKNYKKNYKPGDIFQDCDTCPSMIVVPSGSFMMGSPETEQGRLKIGEKQREIAIGYSFAIGRYEITVKEFKEFLLSANHKIFEECGVFENGKGISEQPRSFFNPGFEQTEEHPAVCVSWYDIQEYIKWLNKKTGQSYRLPSEAEWEYAARAGTQTPYWWGEQVSKDMANYDRRVETSNNPSKDITLKVNTLKPNQFGLFHVHGNVDELTEDCLHSGDPEHRPTNGSAWLDKNNGDCKRRIVKSGSWLNDAKTIRSAYRGFQLASAYNAMTGFRLVREIKGNKK